MRGHTHARRQRTTAAVAVTTPAVATPHASGLMMKSAVMPGATVAIPMVAFMGGMLPSMVGAVSLMLGMALRAFLIAAARTMITPGFVGPAILTLVPARLLGAISTASLITIVVTVRQQGDDAHPGPDRLLHGAGHGARGRCRRQHGASAPRRRNGHDDTPRHDLPAAARTHGDSPWEKLLPKAAVFWSLL